MPELIAGPTLIEAGGEPPKAIQEYVGRVNTGEPRLSVAHTEGPALGAYDSCKRRAIWVTTRRGAKRTPKARMRLRTPGMTTALPAIRPA
jgi:hypothetical protein